MTDMTDMTDQVLPCDADQIRRTGPWDVVEFPRTTGRQVLMSDDAEASLAFEFEAAGTKLLGVSKDPAKKHARFIAKHGLTAPLATDAEEGGLSDALGVWAEKQMYGKTYMGMVRATYLVGPDGKIARIWDKVKVAGHAEDVLAAAKAL